jgi:hypothetical protein
MMLMYEIQTNQNTPGDISAVISKMHLRLKKSVNLALKTVIYKDYLMKYSNLEIQITIVQLARQESGQIF